MINAYKRNFQSELGNYASLVEDDVIAPSPNKAIARIKSKFGLVPDRLGTNCVGLKNVRKSISNISNSFDRDFPHSLMIMAPHTHWEPAPILCTFDSGANHYRIGPQNSDGPFFAISFAFSSAGLVPYEWADISCGIDYAELDKAWSLLKKLNSEIVQQPWFYNGYPYAVSINHRFKKIFSPALASTHESPGSGKDNLSYIVEVESSDNFVNHNADQVGWPAMSPPSLKPDEILLMQKLEKYIGSIQ